MDEQQNIIIYRTADGRASVALFAKDGKIWLNQQQMAKLFATSKQLISHHIANILKEKELNKISVVKQYLTTAADGKNYNVYETEETAKQVYDVFNAKRKQVEAQTADADDLKMLEDLERRIVEQDDKDE